MAPEFDYSVAEALGEVLKYGLIFVSCAILAAVVLGLPAILVRAIRRNGPIDMSNKFGKFSGVTWFMLGYLVLIVIVSILYSIEFTEGVSGFGSTDYVLWLPQAFYDEASSMTFTLYEFIHMGIILALVSNYIILSYGNEKTGEITSKAIGTTAIKLVVCVVFIYLIQTIITVLDYYSSMIILNFDITATVSAIGGYAVGNIVYNAVTLMRDKKKKRRAVA